jgi:cytochrome c oxidase subunit 2
MKRLSAITVSLLSGIASSACEGTQSMFNPDGPAARSIAHLGWMLIAVCLAVYVAVVAVLLSALLRRRRPGDDQPEAEGRQRRVVAAAVGFTVIVLVSFTAASAVVGRGLTSPTETNTLTIDVVGHQWWWDFQYHGSSPSDLITVPNELHIPVGVPVVLSTQSRDVIHSFWVPNLHGKRDLIPGETTQIWIQADEAGHYRGQCAEYCGHQHARMALLVVAEPMEAFQAWLAQQRRPATEPASSEAQRGKNVFLGSTCATCHSIRGTNAGSRIGPDLTHLASRSTLGAGTLPNRPEQLQQWVQNPHAAKPGVRMPPNTLAPEDLQALVAYLGGLR